MFVAMISLKLSMEENATATTGREAAASCESNRSRMPGKTSRLEPAWGTHPSCGSGAKRSHLTVMAQ